MTNPADFNAASHDDRTADSVMHAEDGNRVWRNTKSQLHRTDGPAIERANGNKSWWINGQLHRTDGPAIEYADGNKEWYLNNKKLTEQKFNAHPLVQEAQRQKKAEKAASQAEEATRKAEYDRRMMQVIRDFHAKIRRPS